MTNGDLADRVAGIAALADPIRRDLFLYVSAQSDPVSRDQASDALGIARHTAKFHLDKLAEEGLLDTSFKRLSERRGPGGGRPTKLYTRSGRQLSVTLPERRYDLAGQLLATAIDDATADGTAVADALNAAAGHWGTHRRRPGPSHRRAATRPRTAPRLHLPGPDRMRVRGTPRRRHHPAGQLPLRRAGPGTHRAHLRDEPRHHGRGHRPSRPDRTDGPTRTGAGPVLRRPRSGFLTGDRRWRSDDSPTADPRCALRCATLER